MREINIKFVDSFRSYNERYISILQKHYKITLSDNPDFLFYGPYGTGLEHYKYSNCIKVCMCSEGIIPDYNECDYGIGSHPVFEGNSRYLKIPYVPPTDSMKNERHYSSSNVERKFCNFIYSNPDRGEGAVLRQEFCKELMKYKHVDCPGSVLNNMKDGICARSEADWRKSKQEFLKQYKFTICFENAPQDGMISEKILDAFEASSIPIYWGAPDIEETYNSNAFINCNSIGSIKDMVQKVIEIDQSDEDYADMVRARPISDEFDWNWKEKFEEYLIYIIEHGTMISRDPLEYDSGIRAAGKLNNLNEKRWFRAYNTINIYNNKVKKFLHNRI